MPNARYFLGYGERLTGRIPAPTGGSGPEPPYGFVEAIERISPRASEASNTLDLLPAAACPGDQAVGVVTLHPQGIAKSYYPGQLLNQFNLRHVGSRPTVVTPEKWTRKVEVAPAPSTDLYVAGTRESFRQLATSLSEISEDLSEQVRRIEDVRAPSADERIRGLDPYRTEEVANLEAVLHAADSMDDAFIVEGFGDFAATLGADAQLARRIYAGGLCFVPVIAPLSEVERLSEFAFLRVTRPVSRLRATPVERSSPSPDLSPAPLPDKGPIDADFRVAIFDGGLSPTTPLAKWADAHDADGVGAAVPELQHHGHDVTSALLFGPLVPGKEPLTPYCIADHFRVLDADSNNDPFELFDVLSRIQAVLEDRAYEFYNLSIGPYVPVEDDEVHPWTAVLDTLLSDGRALATVAVGNSGEEPENRIQVPADSVNATAVGAADSTRAGWSRATYSSVGPGRSPGVVKPDVVEFGGCQAEPFLVYDKDVAPGLARTCGTSFASPALLHQATAIRTHFGSRLSPLAIKTLLIHAANPVDHQRDEVGWGKTPDELTDITVCDDGMVRVIYQGELTPSQYLRALIPMPDGTLHGNVTLKATFCYATPVDPEDPGSYTRSGLEVTFRPHSEKFAKEGAVDPSPKSFFKRSEFDPEHQLRRDAQKWETTLHHEQTFRGSSLKDPVFDIHYNAREGGGPSKQAERMRYALVVDVLSPRTADLYDRVSASFAGRLEALLPLVEIPVRV